MAKDSHPTGWLVKSKYQKLTPNRYSKDYKPRIIKPVEAIIYHFTVSQSPTGTARWLCNPSSGVSADFVVSRTGVIYQLAPLEDRTWHAGGKSSKLNESGNVNGRTKGIEIVNWGPLFQDSAGKFWTRGRNPKRIDEEDVFDASSLELTAPEQDEPMEYRFWEQYPPEQIASLQWLTFQLSQLYPDAELLGHEDVDPTRKIDPGPAFPWDRILEAVGRKKPYPKPQGAL